MNDEVLWQCNESELLELARTQGLGRLRRGLPIQDLVAIVSGAAEPRPEHYPETRYTRYRLEVFIQQHMSQLRSQLPGCNGHCTTFPCSEIRHSRCFAPNESDVQ